MKTMYLKTGLSVILLLFIVSLFGAEKKSSGIDLPHSLQNAYASVAERAMPAVVTIYSLHYTGETFTEKAVGSGFIVSDAGYIVTNYHVVQDADALAVKLSDRKVLLGKLVGTSRDTDLAVLKIENGRLPYLKFADTSKVKVGHYAIAIGAPFSLSQTVTTGIVSQKGRSLGLHYREDYIQTDASINPGNSGGPLLNIDGEVIGVNDCIIAPSTGSVKGSVGLGFAIDGNLAKTFVNAMIRSVSPDRPFVGITLEERRESDPPVVSEVVKQSPAAEAGIQKDDLIVQIDSRKVKTIRDVQSVLLTFYKPGDTAEFVVKRKQKELKFKIKIGKPK
jgi:serine protease Do